MPRLKDHRDVSINTLVTPTPRIKWAQFTVHFDSVADLARSSVVREVVAGVTRDASVHQARIVDDAGRGVGKVSWERSVQCNPLSSLPELAVIANDWDPKGLGTPTLPSRAPDRDSIWDDHAEVTCQLRMWADAEQGFSATISASDQPLYTIDFREAATGTIHSFTLDARLELVTVVPSRRLDLVRDLVPPQPS